MKALQVSTMALLLLVQSSSAQVRLGLTAGMNFSQADQSNFYYTKASSTTGVALGALLDCPITKHVSLLVEPTYVEKGTSAQPMDFTGVVPKVTFNLSYLELPLLVKYSVGNDLRPYLMFGPSLGINLSSSVGAQISGPWFGELDVVAGNRGMVRDIECSVELGGGVSYQLDEILAVFVEARYTHALNSVLRQSGVFVSAANESVFAGVQNNAVYRNTGVVLLFGFSIPL